MKRFKAVDFSLNPNVKKQIEREVNILKHIEHENLVKFFELLVVKSEEHFEQFFILTEYYEVSIFISLKVIRHMNKTHPKYYKNGPNAENLWTVFVLSEGGERVT